MIYVPAFYEVRQKTESCSSMGWKKVMCKGKLLYSQLLSVACFYVILYHLYILFVVMSCNKVEIGFITPFANVHRVIVNIVNVMFCHISFKHA